MRHRPPALRACLLLPLLAGLCSLPVPGMSTVSAAEPGTALRVLPEQLAGDITPGDMLQQYYMQLAGQQFAAWRERYETLKTPEQIAAYQQQLREKFLERIGGIPQEKTDLNPRVTGTIARDGFTVEKLLFESEPQHHVSGLVFRPDETKYAKPWPAVLVVCGHSANGKAYDGYQRACAMLALNGILAFIIDPICQGERYQLAQPDGKPTITSSTTGHSLIGLGSTLLGRNTARFEIRDGMRAIDYLQSRDDVDPKRIGCTGNSGGGTQSAYLMALDQRIHCAAPSCYITSFQRLLETIGPQDAEQNIYGQLAFGMDHADYLLMRAPKPTLICCATKDFFDIGGSWNSFRDAKRLFTRMGYSERVDLAENDDTHGFKKPLREAAVRWMVRWLRGEDRVIREPEIEVLSDREAWCTPLGQVVLLAGERSVFAINAHYNRELAVQRKALWQDGPTAAVRARVRQVAGVRPASELPQPQVELSDEAEYEGMRLTKIVLRPQPGLHLPGLLFQPVEKKTNGETVLYLGANGAAAAAGDDGPVRQLVDQGHTVLALDVRGTGETAPGGKPWYSSRFGAASKQVMLAYLLERSFVGDRTEDILAAVGWLQNHTGAKSGGVRLMATDHLCTPALHAAFLHPEQIASLKLTRPLVSWTSIIETPVTKHQLPNMVHGALTVYDLPQLVQALGRKVEIDDPRDAAGEPVQGGE